MPGPLLRVRVGDLVKVHLENALNSMRTHNIDFHFVMGSGGGAGALSVAPGEEGVLEARATAPGFYVFHCATLDIPMHIAKGMYGSVLVEPEEGLQAVGKKLCVVQGEIYTNDDKPGHKSFDTVRADKADPQSADDIDSDSWLGSSGVHTTGSGHFSPCGSRDSPASPRSRRQHQCAWAGERADF